MIEPEDIVLLPPNLAALGVKRQVTAPAADLITIWKTPYPVLRTYERFCQLAGITPYGGGSYERQGDSSKIGFITSGYRDEILEGRKNSPHLYALALDVVAGDAVSQVKLAEVAAQLFMRVGLYPDNNIIHVDLCPLPWIDKFSSREKRYWVCVRGAGDGYAMRQYLYYSSLQQAALIVGDNKSNPGVRSPSNA